VTHPGPNGKDAGNDRAKEKEDTAGNDPPVSPTPFERFEEFARRVVSVPKAEVEERERVYREERGLDKDKLKPA
jgi:hypothetical protein